MVSQVLRQIGALSRPAHGAPKGALRPLRAVLAITWRSYRSFLHDSSVRIPPKVSRDRQSRSPSFRAGLWENGLARIFDPDPPKTLKTDVRPSTLLVRACLCACRVDDVGMKRRSKWKCWMRWRHNACTRIWLFQRPHTRHVCLCARHSASFGVAA